MISDLNNLVSDPSLVGKVYTSGDKSYKVAKADNFTYTDPIDKSVSKNQVNVLFNDALNTFYLWLYGKGPLSEKANLLLPLHGLLFLISSNGSFICTIPQTGYHSLCGNSHGALAGIKKIAQWVHYKGLIQ